MMMGRISYEAFSPVWPDMEEFRRLQGHAQVRRLNDTQRGRPRVKLGPSLHLGPCQRNYGTEDGDKYENTHQLD